MNLLPNYFSLLSVSLFPLLFFLIFLCSNPCENLTDFFFFFNVRIYSRMELNGCCEERIDFTSTEQPFYVMEKRRHSLKDNFQKRQNHDCH